MQLDATQLEEYLIPLLQALGLLNTGGTSSVSGGRRQLSQLPSGACTFYFMGLRLLLVIFFTKVGACSAMNQASQRHKYSRAGESASGSYTWGPAFTNHRISCSTSKTVGHLTTMRHPSADAKGRYMPSLDIMTILGVHTICVCAVVHH